MPALRSISPFRAIVAAAIAVAATGCDGCADKLATPCETDDFCRELFEQPDDVHCDAETKRCVLGCKADSHCPGTDRMCDLRNPDESGVAHCTTATKECSTQAECCPGQACAQDVFCLDAFDKCGENDTCAVKGQKCLAGVSDQNPEEKGCFFERCGADGSCADGLDCFNGWCVGEAPCSRACPEGSVCTPVNNKCFDVGDDPRFPASCRQTCAPGHLLVFVDGHNVFNRCDRDANDCACQPLPPIRAHDTARHTSLALAGNKVLVSAYDADHGDLVLHTFDKATLKREATEWIDGVPETGVIVADPNGPRGGRAAPGQDVGTDTALAHDAGRNATHIAYYAIKDGATPLGDLRYARREGTGPWTTHVVAGRTDSGDAGDAGRYASIALAPDGAPVIAYFRASGAEGSLLKTAIEVARAKSPTPASAADWSIATVEVVSRTPPPCATDTSLGCAETDACIDDGLPNGAGTCFPKAPRPSSCDPACGSDEACVLDGATPVCLPAKAGAAAGALPEGTGLFTSIAFLDGKPVVAWYDRTTKRLKASVGTDSAGGITWGPVVTLDDGGPKGHDVGRFASLAVGPASVGKRIAVAYLDATANQLKLVRAAGDLSGAEVEVVDTGVGDPAKDPLLNVGADAQLAFQPDGGLVVVYQDSTRGDLRVARQPASGGAWSVKTIREEGAGGFHVVLGMDGANAIAGHAIVKARTKTESANRLELLAVE